MNPILDKISFVYGSPLKELNFPKITDCDFIDSGQSGRAIWFEDPAWANIDIGNINLAQSGIIQTFYSSSVNRNTITTHGMSINRERLATWEQ